VTSCIHSGGARAGRLGGGQGVAPGPRGGPPHGAAANPPEDFIDILFCCHVQAVRAPVGLAVVKVLQLVPEEDRRAALPGVLQTVANLLKSRQQGVRYVANIMSQFPSKPLMRMQHAAQRCQACCRAWPTCSSAASSASGVWKFRSGLRLTKAAEMIAQEMPETDCQN